MNQSSSTSTTPVRRKSTPSSSSHSSNEQLHHKKQQHDGFVMKLASDIRNLYEKLYLYETDKIKWMNEPQKNNAAYKPTEVRISIFFPQTKIELDIRPNARVT